MDNLEFFGISLALNSVGYDASMLRAQFPVWVDGRVRHAELVGFGDEHKYDMSTATLLCSDGTNSSRDQIFATGRALATPAVLITIGRELEVWNLADLGGPVRLGDLTYDRLADLTDYRRYLEPNALLSAKRGRQLGLFPQAVEMMTSARKNVADRFAPIVAEALRRTIQTIEPTVSDIEIAREREDSALFAKASQLTIGALTELMIAAKFEVSEQDEDLLREVLAVNFREFSLWKASLEGADRFAFRTSLSALETDIDYSGLEPSLVSEVYETALLPKSGSKKKAGIFYTPPDLARRLVELLPIEELQPGERNVLDPTCGSGTLLLATHDRLAQLDPEPDMLDVHRRLLDSLYGWDADPFAVNIARLCLLLNALPHGNGWKVLRRDALESSQTSNRINNSQPDIVVLNPPWEHSHSISNEERASRFLSRAVELVRPGGLIGAVMPAGWLSKDTCRNDRRRFLELCDLLEVVRLPERVFTGAEYAPCLLIARNITEESDRGDTWLHRRVVRRGTLSRFFSSGFVDESEVVGRKSSIGSDVLTTNHLVKALQRRSWDETLNDVADVLSVPPAKKVNELSGEGEWLWLRRAGSIKGFGSITYDAPLQHVRFPQDFSREETVEPRSFDQVKVLVSAKKRPDNPWRLKPLLDLIGIIPRETLYLVVARADRNRSPAQQHEKFDDQLAHAGAATLAIFALLGSSVASAWVDGQSTILNINRRFILSLPLPPDWLSLAAIGKRLALEAHNFGVSVETSRDLDELVFRLYDLSQEERVRLAAHMSGFTAPEGKMRYPTPQVSAVDNLEPRYYGATLEVIGDRLLLWAPGMTDDDGTWVDPPLAMPGAAAREGATFKAHGKDLPEAIYGFQEMSFVDDEAITRPRSQ